MFLELLKYLYPRDIFNLRGVQKVSKFYNTNYTRLIIETYSLPIPVKGNRLIKLIPKDIYNKKEIKDQRFYTKSFYQYVNKNNGYYPFYNDSYSDIKLFNDKKLIIYELINGQKIFISSNKIFTLFHIEYSSNDCEDLNFLSFYNDNLSLLDKLDNVKILSTFIINRLTGEVTSRYHWNTFNFKPIGRQVHYTLSNTIENYAYSYWYNNKGFLISVDYNSYEYWYDRFSYKKISLKVPEELEEHLSKWDTTPISILEGHFESSDGNFRFFIFKHIDEKLDCYVFESIESGGVKKNKYIRPNSDYTGYINHLSYPKICVF